MSEELSPWQRYKKNLGETRPWDIVNPATEWTSAEVAEERYSICKACPELIKLTSQCKKCGCFMIAKTKLEKATCPLGKW
ncbi:MAG: DUF6171 family protein [bacterium]|jgi:hypothetical protein